jgi:NitT/TauT family transport system permease protein
VTGVPTRGGRGSPVAVRAGRRLRDAAPVVGVFIGVVLAWEVGLSLLGIQQFLLPRPSAIAAALVDQWPTLVDGVTYTATEAVGGLAIGSVIAIAVAFATARWTVARESLLPVAIAANSTPINAFAPITNNWFGSDNQLSRMAIVAVMVFFPIMINTVRGLTLVSPSSLELMRSYAATDWQILRRVRVPNAMPYLFTAFKVATTLSVIGAVVGEYFGGPRSALGVYISGEATLFRFANAWAAIALACLLGIGFYVVGVLAERLVLPWYAAMTKADS